MSTDEALEPTRHRLLVRPGEMELVEPTAGPVIAGVDSPREFYWVLKDPAPLAGMRYPSAQFPWSTVAAAGFQRVVSLEPGSYDPSPLSILFAKRLEDLYHGRPPTDPDRQRHLIRDAVAGVVGALRSGEGVVVHCEGGRGRSGTVIGCALRELGWGGSAVINYLDRLHRARATDGWPEAPWQAKLVRDYRAG